MLRNMKLLTSTSTLLMSTGLCLLHRFLMSTINSFFLLALMVAGCCPDTMAQGTQSLSSSSSHHCWYGRCQWYHGQSRHQCIYFLRYLWRFGIFTRILLNLYRCTIKSILTRCIEAWHSSCLGYDCLNHKRMVRLVYLYIMSSTDIVGRRVCSFAIFLWQYLLLD